MRIAIIAGHGGIDSGAVGNGMKEKDITLVQADEMAKQFLLLGGVEVLRIRTRDDETLRPSIRIETINKWKADLTIDVHINAGGGDGFEALYPKGHTKMFQLGEYIGKNIPSIGQNYRRTFTQDHPQYPNLDRVATLREIKGDRILLEGFFIDNSVDARPWSTVEAQKEMARFYVKCVKEFYKLSEKKAPERVLTWKEEIAIQAIKSLASKGIINSPDSHIKDILDGKPLESWLAWTMWDRLSNKE